MVDPLPKKMDRRKSVVDKTDSVMSGVRRTVGRLQDLWDEIDMDEEMRVTRVSRLYEHLEDTMAQLVESDTAMVKEVHAEIERLIPQVADLRRELGMEPFLVENYVEKSLSLVAERFEVLCTRLGDDPADESDLLASLDGVVAPRSLVQSLQKRMEGMEGTMARRQAVFTTAQNDMRTWTERMRTFDMTDNLVAVLAADAETTVISEGLLETVDELLQAVRGQYTEWVERMQFEYDEAILRLQELWEMAFVASDSRHFPAKFDPKSQTAEAVEDARAEVARLEESYEHRRPVYDALAVWRSHWKERVEYEKQDSNSKYHTVNLQSILRYQSQLEKKLLPSSIAAVKAATEAFLLEHPNEVVLIEGVSPLAYIEQAQFERQLEREADKAAKAELKKSQLESDIKFGTQKTPVLNRRRPITSASASKSCKHPRLGSDGESAPLAAHFPDSSVIVPLREDKGFPETSSPKKEGVVTPMTSARKQRPHTTPRK